jgi:hypothetical protein
VGFGGYRPEAPCKQKLPNQRNSWKRGGRTFSVPRNNDRTSGTSWKSRHQAVPECKVLIKTTTDCKQRNQKLTVTMLTGDWQRICTCDREASWSLDNRTRKPLSVDMIAQRTSADNTSFRRAKPLRQSTEVMIRRSTGQLCSACPKRLGPHVQRDPAHLAPRFRWKVRAR